MTRVPKFRSRPDLLPLSAARLKRFARLARRSGRDREGLYSLEGPRAIEDALRRGADVPFLVVTGSASDRLDEWAAADLLPTTTVVYAASAEEIGKIAHTDTPQGIVAIGRLPERSLDALASPAGRLLLLSDGLRDPGNLGTLLRTLAAVGGRQAILCRGTVDPYNPKALRGSAGLAPTLELAWDVERAAALAWCADRGVAVVALEAGRPDLLTAPLPAGPLALAVGNEAAGLSHEVRAAATAVVGLPMAPGVDSLSVAVAGSIALYVVARERVAEDSS